MNHDASAPSSRPAVEPTPDTTRPRPRSAAPGLRRLGAALMRLLRRAEKRVIEHFRVPPNGA